MQQTVIDHLVSVCQIHYHLIIDIMQYVLMIELNQLTCSKVPAVLDTCLSIRYSPTDVKYILTASTISTN